MDPARESIKALFTPFLEHLPSTELTRYWRDIEVPYDPFYSYGEVLSTFGDASGRLHSMLSSMERICERLTGGRISRLPPVAKDQRKAVCSAFGSPLNNERHVFVSYVREDAPLVQRLVTALRQAGIEVWIDKDGIKPGTRWQQAIWKAIQQGDCFIACFSESYTSRNRTYMNEELVLAIDELRKRTTERA
jgi:TIR domain